MDTISPEKRSALMARIRGKDTAPELTVRRLLHGLGYRYVLHDKRLPGKPDLTFPGRRKVIFVHGCFWHGHACKKGSSVPKTNSEFWTQKIQANQARDKQTLESLAATGWGSLVVWECCTKKSNLDQLERGLVEFLGARTGN